MSFIIVSYYTIDTPYQNVANDHLIPSLKKLGKDIKHDVRGVPNLGSWQKNTSYKSQFIIEMMEYHKENIVFLDCDADILKYPKLFNEVPKEHNFACHILDRKAWYGMEFHESMSKELLSGTLFVRNNQESKAIVQEWAVTCKMAPQVWEQMILNLVLKKNNVKVYELPLSYCYIKSLPDGREPIVKCDDAIIVHNQVSRKFRNKVNPCQHTP